MPDPTSRRPEVGGAAIARPPAQIDGADADIAPLARAPLPGPPSDVAIGDWDDLLCAVKARLRLIGGEGLVATPEPQLLDTAARVQAGVLECVAALDQLHATLAHELARRQQLELEVFDARTALAQAHAELIGPPGADGRTQHLPAHDGPTSLPNRSLFRERPDHAPAHAEPRQPARAVLYVGLDGVRPIDDAQGHDAGDELRMIIAARLTRAVRAEDTVIRIGSGEFACLLADVSGREQLGRLACKLFDAVSAPMKIGAAKLGVRPSIGIAVRSADCASTEALLKNADAAMCRARRDKTSYAFFDEPADVGAHASE